jgi:hypothetical protein
VCHRRKFINTPTFIASWKTLSSTFHIFVLGKQNTQFGVLDGTGGITIREVFLRVSFHSSFIPPSLPKQGLSAVYGEEGKQARLYPG